MRKPEIPTDTRFQIDKLLEQSGQQFSSGELQASLRTAFQAWELITDRASSSLHTTNSSTDTATASNVASVE